LLDLLSITDVVAGSLAHYLTKRENLPPEEITVKSGSEEVLRWLANDGIGLKKMNVSIRLISENQIQASTLEFALENPPANVTIIPVVV
jgi:hypothetical protein